VRSVSSSPYTPYFYWRVLHQEFGTYYSALLQHMKPRCTKERIELHLLHQYTDDRQELPSSLNRAEMVWNLLRYDEGKPMSAFLHDIHRGIRRAKEDSRRRFSRPDVSK
jgi:hypothetical protein